MIPPRRIPPLKGLRAFDAVARHLSYTRAAEELFLTTTAISHRVRNLEQWLGVPLFERRSNSIFLTREGERYFPKIRQAFQLIASAQEDLEEASGAETLKITTTMSFASNWLIPRLADFKEQAGNIDICLEATDALKGLENGEVDVAIRYGLSGTEDGDSFVRQLIFEDSAIPVCVPAIASMLKKIEDILDLACVEYRWNRHSDRDPSWSRWFRVAGLPHVAVTRLEIFNEEHMAIQHALSGRGVALVGRVAASEFLSDRRLVQPFSFELKNKPYYLVYPKGHKKSAAIETFTQWLMERVGHPCFISNR